jgi:NitT/TauT family transport system permease protein
VPAQGRHRPLFIIWLGYEIESKIAMSAALVVFSVVLNSLEGFLSVEREQLELMASLDASRWQTFRMVKFPGALPETASARRLSSEIEGESGCGGRI